jgi:hypothetical protein
MTGVVIERTYEGRREVKRARRVASLETLERAGTITSQQRGAGEWLLRDFQLSQGARNVLEEMPGGRGDACREDIMVGGYKAYRAAIRALDGHGLAVYLVAISNYTLDDLARRMQVRRATAIELAVAGLSALVEHYDATDNNRLPPGRENATKSVCHQG